MAKYGPKPTDPSARFWAKVDKTSDCWCWTGSTNGRYGQFRLDAKRRHVYAHRMAFMLANRLEAIPDGLVVCHHCDNPRCVRPDHLYLGSQRTNLHDAVIRGRRPKPGPTPSAAAKARRQAMPDWARRKRRSPFTPDDVIEIRRRSAAGESNRRIAEAFGVHPWTIHRIKQRQRWDLPWC